MGLSALIHSTDSSVGSLGRAFSLSNIVSVVVISMVILLPMLLCIVSFRRFGWSGFALALVIVSVALGTLLAAGGSTARTAGEFVLSASGMTGILAVVLGLGTLPYVIAASWKSRSAPHSSL